MKNIKMLLSILFVSIMLCTMVGCSFERVSYVSLEINNDTSDQLLVSCEINANGTVPSKDGDKISDKVLISAYSKKTIKLAYYLNSVRGFKVQATKPGTEIKSFHFKGRQDPWGEYQYVQQPTAPTYYVTIRKQDKDPDYLYKISVN